jgi:hypothetical protein
MYAIKYAPPIVTPKLTSAMTPDVTRSGADKPLPTAQIEEVRKTRAATSTARPITMVKTIFIAVAIPLCPYVFPG